MAAASPPPRDVLDRLNSLLGINFYSFSENDWNLLDGAILRLIIEAIVKANKEYEKLCFKEIGSVLRCADGNQHLELRALENQIFCLYAKLKKTEALDLIEMCREFILPRIVDNNMISAMNVLIEQTENLYFHFIGRGRFSARLDRHYSKRYLELRTIFPKKYEGLVNFRRLCLNREAPWPLKFLENIIDQQYHSCGSKTCPACNFNPNDWK